MNIVAAECAVKKHHPEWSNVSFLAVYLYSRYDRTLPGPRTDGLKVYNTTFIRWTTHSPSGLSEKDVVMAKYCDEQAAACGEVEVEGGETSSVGKELADRVATEGGDCCVPKKQVPPTL